MTQLSSPVHASKTGKPRDSNARTSKRFESLSFSETGARIREAVEKQTEATRRSKRAKADAPVAVD